jgi:cysteine-rich repeat protein
VAGAAVGDEGVERCLPSGGGWEEVEACGPGRFCDAGRCLATVCEPGGDFCADALTLATCDARGTRATGAACEPGTFCELVDGEALCTVRECLPGTRRCAGDRQPEACAADGASWSAVAACEGALVCVDGLCGAPVCGDGIVSADNGESCDDANALGCDGCETCGLRSVAVLAPGVVTRSGPPVDVGERDLTIEAWVNVTGDGLLAGLGRGDASDNVRLLVRGGVPVFAYALGSGRSVEVTSAIALTPGWHHVAGVRFGRTNAAIWVDGAFAGYALTGVDRTSIDDSPTAWIGSDGVGAPAAGLIDEVRFSLAAVYTAPFAPARRLEVTGSTVALYHLDEASGATALDATTARRDLALVAGRLPDDCYAGGAPVVCGDGTRAALEGCDDGNLTGGDGCSASCQPESACDGVTGIRGECYRVLGNADWPGAQAQCAAWGGQLVTINDAIEAAWLRTALVGGDNEFWIGLNDRATEGSFGWVSGSSAAYRQWASGEPNNYFFREDCVVMNPGNGGSWNDTVCGDDHPGICER